MVQPSPQVIRERAEAEGFAACGFGKAQISDIHQSRLKDFIDQGQHGTMDWMERRVNERLAPQALWPEAKGLISLGYSYAPNHNPLDRLTDASLANISAYAWGRDYHDIVKKAAKRLARWLAQESDGQVKVFVDTAPVMEKPLAHQAGIGWQGKHTNLVSSFHGSWLFLAEIMTDFELPLDTPARDQCGSCTRCLDICPTAAMPTPYTLDARKCLAYISIEHEGPIPEEYRLAMGNRIYGCDDCLAVCPWNKFAAKTKEMHFHQPEIRNLSLKDALGMDETQFSAFFSGSPVKRIKWHRWIRNALICAGNAHGKIWIEIKDQVQLYAKNEDPVIRESAMWALATQAAK